MASEGAAGGERRGGIAQREGSAAIKPYSMKRITGRLWAAAVVSVAFVRAGSPGDIASTRGERRETNHAASPTAIAPISMRAQVLMKGDSGSAQTVRTGLVEKRNAA